jgi:hypothetical protein
VQSGKGGARFQGSFAEFVKESALVRPLGWNERTVPLMEKSTELSFPTFAQRTEVPSDKL